jgi:hypothetical protein
VKTSKRAQKDVFKRSLENFFASGGSADVLSEDTKISHEEHRLHMDCPLAANPEEFITRGPSMSMGSP